MEMRRYLVIILLMLSGAAFGQGGMGHYRGAGSKPASGPTFTHKYSLTIDKTKCGTANSIDFPVLVSCTNVQLKSVANGGSVTDPQGDDIVFYLDNGLTTIPKFELENWDGTTGKITAWVRIPTIDVVTNVTFYMAAGNASITTFQGGTSGAVWNSNFTMVQHLGSPTVMSATDKTTNANNGTINGTVSAATGQIYGAATFNNINGNYISTTYMLPTTNWTYSFWAKSSTVSDINSRPVGAANAQTGTDGTSVNWGWNGASQTTVYIRNNSGSGSGDIVGATTTNSTNGSWHHMTVVMDNALGAFLYYDGAQVSSNAFYKAISTSTMKFTIGRDFNQTGGSFNGNVDEVRTSNVVRSASWVKTEYNNAFAPGDFGAANFLTYVTIF